MTNDLEIGSEGASPFWVDEFSGIAVVRFSVLCTCSRRRGIQFAQTLMNIIYSRKLEVFRYTDVYDQTSL